MELTKSAADRIVEQINREVGSDVKNLHRASLIRSKYMERIKELQIRLQYENPESNSDIKKAFDNRTEICQNLTNQMQKLKECSDKISEKIHLSKDILMQIKPDLDQIRKLQTLLYYLKVIQDIQKINDSLTKAIKEKDDGKILNYYLVLNEDNDRENSIIGRLSTIDAPYLKYYAIRTAVHWYKILKSRFTSEFENVLKCIGWGESENDTLKQSISLDNISKAQSLAEYLFLIKSPDDDSDTFEAITPKIICPTISIVTKLLVAPYRKRFFYHFTGARQTNRLDKPEWCFTQILSWIKRTHLFIGNTFQPAVLNAGKLDFNIRLEYIRALAQLSIEKIAEDIELISCDDNLFAHLIDETLDFETELRNSFGYPASFTSALSVITQPKYLLKWLSLEEQYCEQKLDAIMQHADPCMLINPESSEDDLKIPKCADQFIRLLEAIKNRYCTLIQPGHQLQFLALQLELIENFRRRLVQLHSAQKVESIPVLNAINYITMVLRDWGEQVHYLHLHSAMFGSNSDDIGSVFESPVENFEHWTNQLLKNLVNDAVSEIKARSLAYRHDDWPKMSNTKHVNENLSLSPSAANMFQVMVTMLNTLRKELSANLFNIALRLIAKQLDDFIVYSLIMNTKFSNSGATQLEHDMTRNLFPLFGIYNNVPDLLFKKIHDAIKLLTMARGNALLLLETLSCETALEEKMNALKELGIISFKPNTCVEVLERRTDIAFFLK